MDFYVIPPTNNLQIMHLGDRYFCLAQLYHSNETYRRFFKNLPENAWVTLDNGAGDHDIVTEEILLDIVEDLQPNEVIPPDILFDSFKTISNAKSFITKMKTRGLSANTSIFFCPQGNTIEEWLMCYKWGLDHPDITTLGMSKIALPKAVFGVTGDKLIMESRHIMFNYLKAYQMLVKPIHLLGMGDPREFEYYTRVEGGHYIRSNDSCNAVWAGMNGLEWKLYKFDRIPTPRDYFDRLVGGESNDELRCLESNIHYLKKTAGVVL